MNILTFYFELNDISAGNYYVRIGFIGFGIKTIAGIEITKAKPVKDLGFLTLESFSENMDEFNVVEERDFIETKIDKRM